MKFHKLLNNMECAYAVFALLSCLVWTRGEGKKKPILLFRFAKTLLKNPKPSWAGGVKKKKKGSHVKFNGWEIQLSIALGRRL